MQNSNKYLLSLMSVAVLVSLSGCATKGIQETKDASQNAIKQSIDYNKVLDRGPNTNLVTVSQNPFLSGSSFTENPVPHVLPKIFTENVVLSTNQDNNIDAYVRDIAKITNLNMNVSDNAKDFLNGINQPELHDGYKETQSGTSANSSKTKGNDKEIKKLPLKFDGSVKELLDQVTQQFNLFWSYDFNTHKVSIFRTETKTFHLNILPGEVETTSSIASTGSATSSKVTYTNKKSNPFESAILAIKVLSPTSQIQSNSTYDMVTVTATPTVLKEVAKYVTALNKKSSSGVMIKLSVYNIKVSRKSDYGINWNAIYNATAGALAWNTGTMAAGLAANIATATFGGTVGSGPWKGSNLIVSAIQNYTDSTYVTGDKFFSLNGQNNPISDTVVQSYIAKTTTLGSTGVTSSDNVQVSVEPATLQTGYIFNVTPMIIKNDQVRIHLSLDMSTLVEMTKQTFGGKDNPITISSPTVKHNKLIQTFSLKNGQTAVISGFTSDTNNVGTSSLGEKKNWKYGGSQGTEHEKTITVIIVTAYIIGGAGA